MRAVEGRPVHRILFPNTALHAAPVAGSRKKGAPRRDLLYPVKKTALRAATLSIFFQTRRAAPRSARYSLILHEFEILDSSGEDA